MFGSRTMVPVAPLWGGGQPDDASVSAGVPMVRSPPGVRGGVGSTSLFAFSAGFEDLRQECDELRFGVPGLCHGGPGKGAVKRCKWLITKPLEHPSAD